MRRTKYVLNPFFEFIESHEIESLDTNFTFNDDIFQKIKQKELFVLSNKRRDAIFFINPTIKIFLEAFQTPQFLSDILTSFAALAEASVEETDPIVQSFFNDMHDRGILISNQVANKISKINFEEAFKAGDVFENYTVIAPLSINRFLHVYLAEKEGEKVVLKMLVLPADMPEKGKNYYKRFFNQEFELIKEVGNQALICQLIDWNVEKNYAVLEYIEGQSLRKISENTILTLTQRLDIFNEVLKSVAILHHKKILHGDIHASNFLIKNDLTVKLIDFDLANREHLQRTEILHEGGVHEYIAPEKIDQNSFDMVKERSDYRSEVYQLGVIMYILLFRKLPFKALTWHELTMKIINEEPHYDIEKIEEMPIIEEIPNIIVDFLKKCLSKNPLNRFENAGAALKKWESEILVEAP